MFASKKTLGSLILGGVGMLGLINGKEAKALAPNFAEWEISLPTGDGKLEAYAEDAGGNVEKRPHVRRVNGIR